MTPADAGVRPMAPDGPPPLEVVGPRLVPLGGPRAMTVRRTLPTRERTLVGAWCFADHYGPDEVELSGGMHVPPHPHTGLQTVSWLFTGEVEHRDSAGHHAFVRPGELNLMTAGRGISHSEVSTPATTVLHGVQLWVALPDRARFVEPGFEHYAPPPVEDGALVARVFLGSLLGRTSPVTTYTPLLGAELLLQSGTTAHLDVDPAFEHGLLLDAGAVDVDGVALEPGELGYLAPGRARITLTAAPDAGLVRLVLLGGPPFGEQIVMWWNFVGRSHDEVLAFRARWQAEVAAAGVAGEDGDPGALPFPDLPPGAPAYGLPVDDPLPPLPAPALPGVRLRPRR